MREGRHASVVLNDAEHEVVEVLLAFLYTGTLGTDWRRYAIGLLHIAHRLEISEIVEQCAAVLTETLNVETAIGLQL